MITTPEVGTAVPNGENHADEVAGAEDEREMVNSEQTTVSTDMAILADDIDEAEVFDDLPAEFPSSAAEVDSENEELQDDTDPSTPPQNHMTRAQSPSVDDSASIPDDTPSVQDSILSSPQSDAVSVTASQAKKGLKGPRRPFDLRFSSRLSSSPLASPRADLPAFLADHSRQSSLASLGRQSVSDVDEHAAPWDVIRWSKLGRLSAQIFSETSKRNFGSPTCLAVTDQIVIGTSKGIILVFDHHQNHKAILGSGTPAAECGSVTALAISADHTTVAAGHATGHIFTWELGRASRPFLHIPAIERGAPTSRKTDGHLQGSVVLHIGFLGFRRTALASADDRGMAFSHLASRGTGALGRTVHTTRVLGRYPDLITRTAKPPKKSSVLAFSPLPLGNVEQNTDSLGLVAMLTPYLLVIVSTTPVAQTQHKAPRPKEVAAHSAMTAALAWFPSIKLKGEDTSVSRTKLAYAWSNVLTVLDIYEMPSDQDSVKDKPPELQFVPRSHYKAEEAIVAVQWLSRSVLAVLTITQQLLIMEDVSMIVTDSFDLLSKDVYHADVYSHQLRSMVETLDEEDASMHGVVADAFHMSFRVYKGRIYLLGSKSVWWGSLTNWADRLLAMMDAGDLIGSIRLATRYYNGNGEKLTIGLPEDDAARGELVKGKLVEIIRASLKYAFGENRSADNHQLDDTRLADLAVVSAFACLSINDQDFLFDEVFPWYDDHQRGPLLIDVLEPYIVDGKITHLPPTALKVLINHFRTTHTAEQLEEIICLLDASAMDLDQVTSLCKQNHLYDAYIYVWTTALQDYVSPLEELLAMVAGSSRSDGDVPPPVTRSDVAHKLFAYMSFVLTGRVYPTSQYMREEQAAAAKLQLYDYLFSGTSNKATSSSTTALMESVSEASFPALRTILHYDAASFMAVLNEAFEDSSLNSMPNGTDPASTSGDHQSSMYNRQFLIRILLGVMSIGFDASQTIYLDMFIARNLPKYPQYMLFSNTNLRDIFVRLCHPHDLDVKSDAQLSVEYLLSVYQPPDVLGLVPILMEAQYYRVLKTVYRQEQQYAEFVRMYFLDTDSQSAVFGLIVDCLRAESSLTEKQRNEVIQVVLSHSSDMCRIDTVQTAIVTDAVMPTEHETVVRAINEDPQRQFEYLKTLLEPEDSSREASQHINGHLLHLYMHLMCQYQPMHVIDFVKKLKDEDLGIESMVPAMEANGVIDAAIVLFARQGQVATAIKRLTDHIATLTTALTGILETAHQSPDEVGTNEAIEDLLVSLDRYVKVGIWICQEHSRTVTGSRSAAKSPYRMSVEPALTSDESFWLDLLVAVVAVAQGVVPASNIADADDTVTSTIRNVIQNVFGALLATTTSARDTSRPGNDFVFLRIFRAFLTRAAECSPSLSQLRTVISSIFSAYAYEESLISLSNIMLDKHLFVHVDEVAHLRQRGWRPRGQICESCRRRVWGPGTGLQIWESWEEKENSRCRRRFVGQPDLLNDDETDSTAGKGKSVAQPSSISSTTDQLEARTTTPDSTSPVIVFSCRHLYHQTCLIQARTSHGHEERIADLTMARNRTVRCPLCEVG